jgi:putative flavoprotein involved in K+ transport
VQDVGLIDAVRKGSVEIVAAVESFEDGKVVLADGTRVEPDAVIAATGYRRALEDLVGHLDVLDPRGKPLVHGARTPDNATGLYFTGFTNPISGMLRELAIDAEKIAKAIAGDTAGKVSRLPTDHTAARRPGPPPHRPTSPVQL